MNEKENMLKYYWWMYAIVAFITVFFFKLANDYGGVWINVFIGISIWCGVETVLFVKILYDCIELKNG